MLMTKEVEVDRMCDLSQIFIDKGMGNGLLLGESKGKEESNVACVRSLSKHLSIRYEEAMDLLEIEETLRPLIRCRHISWHIRYKKPVHSAGRYTLPGSPDSAS